MNEGVLGRKVTEFPGYFDKIFVPAGVDQIILESDEVTGTCPVTSQPDFYTVTISIFPDGESVESKSLKLYLQSIGDGLFCEGLADQIAEDLFVSLKIKAIIVTVEQKPRGGISIMATASRSKEEEDNEEDTS